MLRETAAAVPIDAVAKSCRLLIFLRFISMPFLSECICTECIALPAVTDNQVVVFHNSVLLNGNFRTTSLYIRIVRGSNEKSPEGLAESSGDSTAMFALLAWQAEAGRSIMVARKHSKTRSR
jgi:hypothetical protein